MYVQTWQKLTTIMASSVGISGALLQQFEDANAYEAIIAIVRKMFEVLSSPLPCPCPPASPPSGSGHMIDEARRDSVVSAVFSDEADSWRMIDEDEDNPNPQPHVHDNSNNLDAAVHGLFDAEGGDPNPPSDGSRSQHSSNDGAGPAGDHPHLTRAQSHSQVECDYHDEQEQCSQVITSFSQMIFVGADDLPLLPAAPLPFTSDIDHQRLDDSRHESPTHSESPSCGTPSRRSTSTGGGRIRNVKAFQGLLDLFMALGAEDKSDASQTWSMASVSVRDELRSSLLNHMLASLCGHLHNYRLLTPCQPLHILVRTLPEMRTHHQLIVVKVRLRLSLPIVALQSLCFLYRCLST